MPSPFDSDGGEKVRKLPRSLSEDGLRALGHPESPIKAIRAKCIDCCAGQQETAARLTVHAMSNRKGELTKSRILRDWPYHVLVRVPELGLGTRLNEMHAYCRGVDYKTTGGSKPGEPDATQWCFRSAGAANAFRETFASGINDRLED